MRICCATVLLGCCFSLAYANHASPQEESSWEDELLSEDDDAYTVDDSVFEQPADEEKSTTPLWLQSLLTPAHFTLRQETAYGIDEPNDLVINRSTLRLQWDSSFGEYYFFRYDGKSTYDAVYNSSDYNETTRDKYRNQNTLREMFILGTFDSISVKAGKQLIVWGKADGAVVTDVMSSRDLTELVFKPLEDARLSQNALVVNYYANEQVDNSQSQAQRQWQLVLTPGVRVNDYANQGHPYAINTFADSGISIIQNRPGFSWRDMEVGLRWSQTVDKFDLAVMVADVVEDNPAYVADRTAALRPTLAAEYARYKMIGSGINYASGNFVWKGELAYKTTMSFSGRGFLSNIESDVVDAAAGFDYDASGSYFLSLELSNKHVRDWSDLFATANRNETNLYTVVKKDWLNETLTTQYTSMLQLQDSDAFHRVEMIYKATDQWTVEIQLDYFHTEEKTSLLGRLEDKHRLLFQIDFDF